jgi:chromosome segregation ATPase
MQVSRSASAFFNGTNPYTRCELPHPQPEELACSASVAAPSPPVVEQPSAPPPDPQEVLAPLHQAQQELSMARSKLSGLRQSWNAIGNDVSSASRAASSAESQIYRAEGDDETQDNSSTGTWAGRSLDDAERSLQGSRYGSGSPSSILYEVKGHMQAAESYLGRVDAQRLQYPYKHDALLRDMHQFPNQLSRLESVQQQIEWKLSSCNTPLSKAQSATSKVAYDGPDKNVSWDAKDARYALSDLQGQLREVESHLRSGESDLSGLESLLSGAESTVQTVSQEYNYGWQTSDRRRG